MRNNLNYICTSSQFVKQCTILSKIHLGTYLTVIAQFICEEKLHNDPSLVAGKLSASSSIKQLKYDSYHVHQEEIGGIPGLIKKQEGSCLQTKDMIGCQ